MLPPPDAILIDEYEEEEVPQEVIWIDDSFDEEEDVPEEEEVIWIDDSSEEEEEVEEVTDVIWIEDSSDEEVMDSSRFQQPWDRRVETPTKKGPRATHILPKEIINALLKEWNSLSNFSSQ